ncbi:MULTISPECIES: ribose-phosphate pyrophosphokinase [unclassified Legionella]|uniref:ribose-phosphate diphosphokinase n=1 Tax=unclassified Legionella TaxID=2622702 RepID=UPI0010555C3D|nr:MULTISPECIES: ribose-phosphate pyrophosphokinase [unclassified Legionella]MDI9818375.1 ribose-phosphate pyrophosphokinase [Legionella sp. PL877]
MDIKLFALETSRNLGKKIAAHLAIQPACHEEREFEDGEHKVRSLENVRGQDVFLLQSLFSDDQQSVNDKLCRLLFFIGALKDASARQITAIIPYFAYARKDRKTQSRDPITMRYMAQLLEAIGADRIVTLDVHNLAAFQNAFRIPTEHLETRILFAPYLIQLIQNEEVVIVSPDAGGAKRAEQLRETLQGHLKRDVGMAFLDKKRSLGVVSSDQNIVGHVKAKTAIIVDDIISSGTTIGLAVEALHQQKAKKIIVCASHGLFIGNASKILADPRLHKVIITDSVSPFRLHKDLLEGKITMLDTSLLFAETIKQIHQDGSISNLLNTFLDTKRCIITNEP